MRNAAFVAALVAATSLCGLSAAAQDADGDAVVAIVNGEELTRADLVASYEALPEQYRQMPVEAVYEPLLQRLVDGELLLQRAEKESIGDEEEVAEAVRRAQEDVLRQAYLARAIDAKVTDEALQAAYEARKGMPGFATEEVKARHILVETEEEAREIIVKLEEGADFAELAKEHSTGPSGPDGGDLGYFERGAMVPEFGDAAFAMEPGTHTADPVKTDFGWHVILVEDKRTTEPTFEELEPQLRQELAAQSVTEVLEDIRDGADITCFNIDGSEQAVEEEPKAE